MSFKIFYTKVIVYTVIKLYIAIRSGKTSSRCHKLQQQVVAFLLPALFDINGIKYMGSDSGKNLQDRKQSMRVQNGSQAHSKDFWLVHFACIGQMFSSRCIAPCPMDVSKEGTQIVS